MKIIVPAARLHNAVKNAVPFTMSPKDMTPVLAAANLVVRNKRLILEATDRYKLIQIVILDFKHESSLNDPMPEDQQIGVIPVEDLKMIEQNLRNAAKSKQNPTVTIEYLEDSESLTITDNLSGSSQRAQLFIDAQYPKIDRLFPDEFESQEPTDFNQFGLARLQEVMKVQHARFRKEDQNMYFRYSPDAKPMRIYWTVDGDVWAQGLLNPIRVPDGFELSPRYF